jgi:hypothetical protein
MEKFTIDIDSYAEGAVILTGLEDCIVGVVEEFGNGKRLLYDKNRILTKLMETHQMTSEEAEEYYDYNILGLYAGEQNAVFLDRNVLSATMIDGNLTCELL